MGPIDLGAGIAESGEHDDGVGAEAQGGAHRQLAELETPGRDVLAEPAAGNVEPIGLQALMHLTGHEVHLAQVRTGGVLLLTAQVLGGRPGMGIALDTDAGQEHELLDGPLREGVIGVAVETHDGRLHGAILADGSADRKRVRSLLFGPWH